MRTEHAILDLDRFAVDRDPVIHRLVQEAPCGSRRRAQRSREGRATITLLRRAGRDRRLAHLAATVGTLEDKARIGQSTHRGSIGIEPATLQDRVPVPVQSEPAERGLRVVGACGDPRGVQIVHPQQDLPAQTARQSPVHQEGEGMPEMQGPGGAWRQPGDSAA